MVNLVFTAGSGIDPAPGLSFTDTFPYTNGTALTANGYTQSDQNGGGVLTVNGGAVRLSAANAWQHVTKALDPGSDNVFWEADVVMTGAPTLNVTRIIVRINDLEFRFTGTGNLVSRKGASGLPGGADTWTPSGAEQTIRVEVSRSADTIRMLTDDVEQVSVGAVGMSGPFARAFVWGIQIGNADAPSDIEIREVRTGAL